MLWKHFLSHAGLRRKPEWHPTNGSAKDDKSEEQLLWVGVPGRESDIIVEKALG